MKKVTVAVGMALSIALLTIVATGERSEAQVTPPVIPALELTVESSEVGFGAVQIGTTEQRTVTITNTTGTAITIGAIKFTDPVTGQEIVSGPFSLADPLPVGGIVIQPGESTPLDLNVEFSPTVGTGDPGETVTALLTFTEGLLGGTLGDTINIVNEAGETVTGIDVSGTGTTDPPGTQPGVQADCTITGTNNGETLTGTPLQDVICGLGGNDRINGLANNDILRGGTGNDRIMSKDKAGLDKLYGQGGRDNLNAKDGGRGDILKGGGDKDKVVKDRKDKGKS